MWIRTQQGGLVNLANVTFISVRTGDQENTLDVYAYTAAGSVRIATVATVKLAQQVIDRIGTLTTAFTVTPEK